MFRIINDNIIKGELFLFNTIFQNLISINGGSIEITKSNSFLFLFFCSFLNCSSTTTGGAIYFSSLLGSFQMDKCCGYYCFSNQFSFSYTSLVSFTSNLHVFNRSSISFCSPSINILRYHTSVLDYGFNIVYLCNFSKNFIKDHLAGFGFRYSLKVYCSDNTIINSQSDIVVGSSYSEINIIFNRFNIVNNSQSQGNYGLFHMNSNSQIFYLYNWIFLNNYCSLFDIFQGITYLYDCIMDHYQYGRGFPILGTCPTNIKTNTHYFNLIQCSYINTNNNFKKKLNIYSIILKFLISSAITKEQ